MGDVAGRESVTKYQFLCDINDLKKITMTPKKLRHGALELVP